MSDAADHEFAIDSYVPESWQNHHIAQLSRWHQGHLIERPGLTWIGPVVDDPITGLPGLVEPETNMAWDAVLLPEIEARYGIVCSQTCDIGGEGPGRRHPFIQISPVVNLEHLASDKQTSIRRHEQTHYVALTAAGLGTGFWVADLRLSVPLSKALLLDREPLPAFATYQDEMAFSEHLASRLRRPALHSMLSEDLPQSLDAFIKNQTRAVEGLDWKENVAQIRLLTTDDRLREQEVTIIVLGRQDFEHIHKCIWRRWYNQNRRKFPGFRIQPLMFSTMMKLPALYYFNSVPLRIKSLGLPPSW